MAVDICPLFRKKGGTPMDQLALVLIIVLLIIMELKTEINRQRRSNFDGLSLTI